MKCKELMKENPAYCIPTDYVQHAAALMQRYVCGLIPVVESEFKRKPIGVITDRDLCLGVIAQGRDPRLVHVKECMTKSIVRCRPDDDVEKCLALLERNQIRRMPICKRDGRLVGMICLADIALHGDIPPERVWQLLKGISGSSEQSGKPRQTAVKALLARISHEISSGGAEIEAWLQGVRPRATETYSAVSRAARPNATQ